MSAPVCELCGDVAPYGDERMLWLFIHGSWWHRTMHKGLVKALAASKVQQKLSGTALLVHILLCFPAGIFGWVNQNSFIAWLSLDALVLACFGWWVTSHQGEEIVEKIVEDPRIPTE